MRFDSLLLRITKQTGVRFSLDTRKFRPSSVIHLRRGGVKVIDILNDIRIDAGAGYVLLGDHIIFAEPHDQGSAGMTIRGRKSVSGKRMAGALYGEVRKMNESDRRMNDPVRMIDRAYPGRVAPRQWMKVAGRNAATDQHTLFHTRFTDSAHLPVLVNHGPALRRNLLRPRVDNIDLNKRDSRRADRNSNKDAKGSSSGGNWEPFIRPGLSFNDALYGNLTIEAGIPIIHAIGQYSTNFTISGLRYGIGSSIGISDRWRIGLNATTGANSKNYQKDSAGAGSPVIPFSVKTHLHMIGLTGETHLNDQWILQFGPTLHILQTKYDIPANDLFPINVANIDADKSYRFIYPLYTIHHSFSAQPPASTRIWIGLQVSLLYDLNLFKRKK